MSGVAGQRVLTCTQVIQHISQAGATYVLTGTQVIGTQSCKQSHIMFLTGSQVIEHIIQWGCSRPAVVPDWGTQEI
jgi:hypothetical protein